MANTIKHKRGTVTEWTTHNPVLAEGEIGVETDVAGTPQAIKIGDGVSNWNALPYISKASPSQPAHMNAFGLTGLAGTSTYFARADHRHSTPNVPDAIPSNITPTSPNYAYGQAHTHAIEGFAPFQSITVDTPAATAAKTITEAVTLTAGVVYVATFTLGSTVSNPTLNGVNIVLGGTNVSTTTFNLPANSVALLYYDGSKFRTTGSYRTSDSTETYAIRWNASLTNGTETLNPYKIVMFGADGCVYPLTLENSTASNKTVCSELLDIGMPILLYYSSGATVPNGTTVATSIYTAMTNTVFNRTDNQLSGWVAGLPIYIKGEMQTGSLMKLYGAGTSGETGFLTQTLPTTADGYVYILLGIMTNTTTGIRIGEHHPVYEYKGGGIRLFVPPHTHNLSELSGVANAVHSHDDYYISLFGGKTLTNMSDKRNMWLPIAQFEIKYDDEYNNSFELVSEMMIDSYSDSREPQESFVLSIIMQMRGSPSTLDFEAEEPLIEMFLSGRYGGATDGFYATDVVCSCIQNDTSMKVYRIFILNSASNKSYRTKIMTSRGMAYSNISGEAKDSIDLIALNEETPLVTFPYPIFSREVFPLIRWLYDMMSNFEEFFRTLRLINPLMQQGTHVLELMADGTVTKRTLAQALSDMGGVGSAHVNAEWAHAKNPIPDLATFGTTGLKFGEEVWFEAERKILVGLGDKKKVFNEMLGIINVYSDVGELLSYTPAHSGVLGFAEMEGVFFASVPNPFSVGEYMWKPLAEITQYWGIGASLFHALPSVTSDHHRYRNYASDKDIFSIVNGDGHWKHIPALSAQRQQKIDSSSVTSYSVVPFVDKYLFVDADTASVDINLPPAADANACEFVVKNVKGTNRVYINPSTTELIEGASAINISSLYEYVTIVSDGNCWRVVGGTYST